MVVKRYFKIWWRSSIVNWSIISSSRIDFYTFVLGKLIRMLFFFFIIAALFNFVPTLAGYSKGEVLLFMAMYNLIDIITQLVWFRGLTDLNRLVRKGDFDLVLTKPMSPLFWSAFRIFDFFDLTTIPVALYFLWYGFTHLATPVIGLAVVLGVITLLLALVLAFSVNLILAATTFWTVENENIWWIYRYLGYGAHYPPEVYPPAFQFVFTFIFPIIVIVAFPVKAFLGILSPAMVVWAALAVALFLSAGLLVWRAGVRRYASASA